MLRKNCKIKRAWNFNFISFLMIFLESDQFSKENVAFWHKRFVNLTINTLQIGTFGKANKKMETSFAHLIIFDR